MKKIDYKISDNGFYYNGEFYFYNKIISIGDVYTRNGHTESILYGHVYGVKWAEFNIRFDNNFVLNIRTDNISKKKYMVKKVWKIFPKHVIDPEYDAWYKDLTEDKELLEMAEELSKFYKELFDKVVK